jgi:hypothetical protein
MHLLRLLILALIAQHRGQAAHARQRGMNTLCPALSRSARVLVDATALPDPIVPSDKDGFETLLGRHLEGSHQPDRGY